MKYLVLLGLLWANCAPQNGEDGPPGVPGSIVKAVLVCPHISGTRPEYLLSLDGALFGVVTVSGKTRLAAVPAGTYTSNDARNCTYKVNADNSISY